MKDEIKELLENELPLVDFDSDFVFTELDSLGITTIMMVLSERYGIELDHRDSTPKNLKNIETITAMVERKLAEK
jgi:acyl carrier protein